MSTRCCAECHRNYAIKGFAKHLKTKKHVNNAQISLIKKQQNNVLDELTTKNQNVTMVIIKHLLFRLL